MDELAVLLKDGEQHQRPPMHKGLTHGRPWTLHFKIAPSFRFRYPINPHQKCDFKPWNQRKNPGFGAPFPGSKLLLDKIPRWRFILQTGGAYVAAVNDVSWHPMDLRTPLKSASVRGPEETKRENCWCVRGGKGERYSWHHFRRQRFNGKMVHKYKIRILLGKRKKNQGLFKFWWDPNCCLKTSYFLSKACLCQVSRGILSIWDRRCYCLLDEGGLVSGEEMTSYRYAWYIEMQLYQVKVNWVFHLSGHHIADSQSCPKNGAWKWSYLLKESSCLCWKTSSFEEFALCEIVEKYTRLKQWIYVYKDEPNLILDFYAYSDFLNSSPNNLLLGSQYFLTVSTLFGMQSPPGLSLSCLQSCLRASLQSLCLLISPFGIYYDLSPVPLICQAKLFPLYLYSYFANFGWYIFFLIIIFLFLLNLFF